MVFFFCADMWHGVDEETLTGYSVIGQLPVFLKVMIS